MPTTRTETVTLYEFKELSDDAKETARDWYKSTRDSGDFDAVIEDAVTCGGLIGFEFESQPVKLMNGSTRYDPRVWWSLSYSQGDGADFDGTYAYKVGALKAIKAHAPQDETLHDIAKRLQDVQRKRFYKVEARIASRHNGHYPEVTTYVDGDDAPGDVHEPVKQCVLDFCAWIYKQLRAENDYQTSDEYVDESIECNAYTFDEDGNRRD